MIHNITAGPVDLTVARRLLNEMGDGSTLGGWKVRFEDDSVIIPWKGGTTNRVAEEFAIRLQRQTGCALKDSEHGRVIQAGQLVGLGREKAAG